MAQLKQSSRRYDGSARDRQKRLADTLVATLGLEGAIYVCHPNTWHGILAYVISARGAGEAIAG